MLDFISYDSLGKCSCDSWKDSLGVRLQNLAVMHERGYYDILRSISDLINKLVEM